MNCTQAKQISLLHILYKIGHKEAFTRSSKGTTYYWFTSPFRPSETEPSFSLNIHLNTFYDYGSGVSGTVIDYICAYYQCDIPKALELLQDFNFSFSQQVTSEPVVAEKKENDEGSKIISIRPIQHRALIQYLSRRKLNTSLQKRFLVQVDYTTNGSSRFAVGFKNNSEGYELNYECWSRQEQAYIRIKQCLVKKDITHINHSRESVVITESWSDFLALLTLHPKMESRNDFIILNSVSMRDRMIEKINEGDYKTIYSAVDNDLAGNEVLENLVDKFRDRVIPLNAFYQGYKDVSEYLEKASK